MTREATIQVGVLYGPLVMAGVLTFWLRPDRRLALGLLFSTIWQAALLPWFDLAARALGLWSYDAGGPTLAGIPLALYFGWIIAWGWLAPLAVSATGKRWPIVLVALIALDLGLMPHLAPVVQLSPYWWLADLILFAGLLAPGLWLCSWTHRRVRLEARVALLVGCFAGTLLGLPMLASMQGEASLDPLLRVIDEPIWLVAGLVLALPGLAAMRDLARTGGGTPVPLDPAVRLVTHGVYAYISNPMQVSMTLLLLLEAWYLRNGWPVVIAGLGVIYSEGFARWSETRDMESRFGSEWASYRSSVRPWIPRWRPSSLQACELWVDLECGPCQSVAGWFGRRRPVGLRIRNAREWQGDPLRRITWCHPASGRRESGVAAVSMALQHLTLPWAAAGVVLAAPGLRQTIQCCLDAAGLGPRSCSAERPESVGK